MCIVCMVAKPHAELILDSMSRLFQTSCVAATTMNTPVRGQEHKEFAQGLQEPSDCRKDRILLQLSIHCESCKIQDIRALEKLNTATKQMECDVCDRYKRIHIITTHYGIHCRILGWLPSIPHWYMTFSSKKLVSLLGLQVAQYLNNTEVCKSLTLDLTLQQLVEMLTDPGVGVPKKFFLPLTFTIGNWDLVQIRSFDVDGDPDSPSLY
ncbi:hypothetical protein BDK51DRAFT_26998 [Blyttiomyces helicus]|uniref:Uncharacterized protein n=1 Tax=Blyttiomyces helicus TaxID=388810 RepID=A0A4P9WMF1_9FUNG|nr:hypothetical protein BDK51DRAFT_26998 [Blyttiomyces helicus]|eukprot:RKO94251.1 hypothetical protein BDK51DRAFT_26998 [Blyttiomyces helicus]